jgi:hypothetical protein
VRATSAARRGQAPCGLEVDHELEPGRLLDCELGDDGIVYDTDRIMFLRNYLTHLQRATAEA